MKHSRTKKHKKTTGINCGDVNAPPEKITKYAIAKSVKKTKSVLYPLFGPPTKTTALVKTRCRPGAIKRKRRLDGSKRMKYDVFFAFNTKTSKPTHPPDRKDTKPQSNFDNTYKSISYNQSLGPPTTKNIYSKSGYAKYKMLCALGREPTKWSSELVAYMREILERSRKTYETTTPADIKRILGNLGHVQLYRNHVSIRNDIFSKPPLPISPESIEILCDKFEELEEKWPQIEKGTRKNMPRIDSLLRRWCYALGEDAIVDQFPEIKSRENMLAEQKLIDTINEHLHIYENGDAALENINT
jgi:hypothetical protein